MEQYLIAVSQQKNSIETAPLGLPNAFDFFEEINKVAHLKCFSAYLLGGINPKLYYAGRKGRLKGIDSWKKKFGSRGLNLSIFRLDELS